MKTITILFLSLFITSSVFSQAEYEPNNQNPFGLPNPEAPEEIKDYQPLIGICDCKSIRRNAEGEWTEPIEMSWEFKYILNGMAIQDQTLKEDGIHSGSIRQFDMENSTWNVHYFTSGKQPANLPSWQGGMQDGDIVLYRSQKSPNGNEGKYKITFSEISEEGFNWLGQWVSLDGSVKYPTWKIECKKRKL